MIVIQDILAKKPIDIIPYWCKTLLTINSRKSILTQNKYFVSIFYRILGLNKLFNVENCNILL